MAAEKTGDKLLYFYTHKSNRSASKL